jgi:Ca2+-binding RTX toxin-like protein
MSLPIIDRLEARRLFIGGTDGPGVDPTAVLENGVLTITDTDDAHDIKITIAKGNALILVAQGDTELLNQTFKAGDFSLIMVDAAGGDDVVTIDSDAIVPGPVYVNLGFGNDDLEVSGSSGNDTFTGAAGNDTIHGGAGDDRLNGGPGKDKIYGEDGADRIYGGDSNDYMDGGAGVDRLFGEAGYDFLVGGSSNDKLYGGDGNDTLAGGKQDDILKGEGGDDVIYGGPGINIIDGGDGIDSANHLSTDLVFNVEHNI